MQSYAECMLHSFILWSITPYALKYFFVNNVAKHFATCPSC